MRLNVRRRCPYQARVQLVVGLVRGSSRATGNNCNCSGWSGEKIREIGQRKCRRGTHKSAAPEITQLCSAVRLWGQAQWSWPPCSSGADTSCKPRVRLEANLWASTQPEATSGRSFYLVQLGPCSTARRAASASAAARLVDVPQDASYSCS